MHAHANKVPRLKLLDVSPMTLEVLFSILLSNVLILLRKQRVYFLGVLPTVARVVYM
jgi:hypothetical protein